MITTVDSIIEEMRKGSITLGWDVIVAYSRNKCNQLLALQYLTAIADQKHNIIKGAIIEDESNQYELSDLFLGIPLLSFENGSLEHSTATLIMPFISGRLDSYTRLDGEPRYLKSSTLITESGQYTLIASINLRGGATGGSDNENIFIDLTESNLTFTTNFNEGTKANQVIGTWFKEQFRRSDLPFNRVILGKLKSANGSPLNPTQFRLATQPASPPSSGNGTVLAFIQTRSPQTGKIPTDGSGFPWLIPNEKDDKGEEIYGSSIIISRDTAYRDFYLESIKAIPGGFDTKILNSDARFPSIQTGAVITGSGTGVSWSTHNGGITVRKEIKTNTFNDNKTILRLSGINYTFTEGGILANYNGTIIVPAETRYCMTSGSYPECNYIYRPGTFTVTILNLDISYRMVYFPESLSIRFINISSNPPVLSITGSNFPYPMDGDNSAINNTISNVIVSELKQLAISFKGLELFPTANLLFPEQNAFRLLSAHIPCDVIAFGQLDTDLTGMEITPKTQLTGIGQTCQFLTGTPATWKVLNIDGKTPGLGSINSSGVYTPPQASGITQAATQELIIATSGSKTAKAMVTVLASPITIDPAFYFVNIDGAMPIKLRASSLRDSDMISWEITDKKAGGAVSGSNRTATYSPPPSLAAGPYAVDVIAAINNATTQASYCPVLNFKKPSGRVGMVTLLPDGDIFLRPSQQTELLIDNSNIFTFSGHRGTLQADKASAAECPFTIVYGGGIIEDRSEGDVTKAVYTAPHIPTTICAIVTFYQEEDIPGIGKFKTYTYKIIRFPPAV